MKRIYVTYTRVLHNLTKARYAVECETEEQAKEAAYHLNARPNVQNIRINRSGRNLPPESAIFFFNEFMSLGA